MKCEEIEQHLNAFVDNELNVENSQIIKAHIAGCEPCFREVERIERLKKHLISFKPSLSSDFDLKLHQRIEKANHKSRVHKALPLVASIALIVPVIHYLTFQPPVAIQQTFITELQSIGTVTANDDEDFHKWTQLDDSNQGLQCSGLGSVNHCAVDLSYFPKV